MAAGSPPLVVSSNYNQPSSSSSVPTSVPAHIPSTVPTAAISAPASTTTSTSTPSSTAPVSAPTPQTPHNGPAPIPTQTHSYPGPVMNTAYNSASLYYHTHPQPHALPHALLHQVPHPLPPEYAIMPAPSIDMSMMPPPFYPRMPYPYSTPPAYTYHPYIGYCTPALTPTGYIMPPQIPPSTPYYSPMMPGLPGTLPLPMRTPVAGSQSTTTPVSRTWTARQGQGKSQAGHRSRASYTSNAGTAASNASGRNSAGTGVSATVVRGPPRKPRQSGYAVWIGNLPVKTDLMDLVGHVCDMTANLESLFLIAKSNCAFANFTDEASWHAALAALHDSEFHTLRLVARHRRLSPDGTSEGAPGSPEVGRAEETTEQKEQIQQKEEGKDESEEKETKEEDKEEETERKDKKAPPVGEPKKLAGPPPMSARDAHRDRFFVLKSLTVDDLQQSTRTGVWATQSHNESVLNEAYTTAANVFLIFSANKSGEYFGYARMMSALNPDPAAAIEFAPLSTPAVDAATPLSAAVPPRGNIPAGRIVNDALRGTIFWELDCGDSRESCSTMAAAVGDMAGGADAGKALGKPFKLKWLSTSHVGFHRTKGIANAWNGNREVKIARDGTEIEPGAGEKLVQLFHESETAATTTAAPSAGRKPSVAAIVSGTSALGLQ